VTAVSYLKGTTSTLVGKTLGDILCDTAEQFGDHAALVSRHRNVGLTCTEFHD
jgi:hypothetical protein